MQTKSDVFRALFEQDIGWIKPCVCNRNWRGIWILQISYWPISMFIHKFWRSLGLKSRVQKRKEQNTTENRAARAYPWPASSVGSRVNSKHSTHPTCRRIAQEALAWGGQSWGGANSNKNHRETAIFNLPWNHPQIDLGSGRYPTPARAAMERARLGSLTALRLRALRASGSSPPTPLSLFLKPFPFSDSFLPWSSFPAGDADDSASGGAIPHIFAPSPLLPTSIHQIRHVRPTSLPSCCARRSIIPNRNETTCVVSASDQARHNTTLYGKLLPS